MGSMVSGLFGGGGGGSAPDPNPEVANAAQRNFDLGRDWLNFGKDTYAAGQQRQTGIDATTGRVVDSNLATQDAANANSAQIMDRYKSLFQPVEDRAVSDAQNWDSTTNQETAAAKAKADVMRESAAADGANTRKMASMGVSPASGRFAGVDRAHGLDTALASVGAQNTARDTLKSQGTQMRQQAASYGLGTTGVAAQQTGIGLTAGNSATSNELGANSAWQANNNNMTQGYQGAVTANNAGANILNGQDAQKFQAWAADNANSSANQSAGLGAIGTLGGAAISKWSSKKLKTNKRPIDGALQAIKGLPVEKWKYKPGVDDEGEHIGPYAEDFAEATGIGDGTKINLQDALGLTMKAVQELSDKVDSIPMKKAS